MCCEIYLFLCPMLCDVVEYNTMMVTLNDFYLNFTRSLAIISIPDQIFSLSNISPSIPFSFLSSPMYMILWLWLVKSLMFSQWVSHTSRVLIFIFSISYLPTAPSSRLHYWYSFLTFLVLIMIFFFVSFIYLFLKIMSAHLNFS